MTARVCIGFDGCRVLQRRDAHDETNPFPTCVDALHAPQSLGPGEYSVPPSECVHPLRTGKEPVWLASVWRGDDKAPNWWWRQDATGGWRHEHWQWRANHEWRSQGSEAISPEMLERASL